MSFIALILTFFAILHFLPIRRAPGLATTADKACYAAAFAFLMTGVSHFTSPTRFMEMMPPFIPAHAEMIMISGVAEIAGALGLMIPTTRWAAGMGLLVLLVVVSPANVYLAMAGETVRGMPSASWPYWVRSPFQFVHMAWIYRFAVRRPSRKPRGGAVGRTRSPGVLLGLCWPGSSSSALLPS